MRMLVYIVAVSSLLSAELSARTLETNKSGDYTRAEMEVFRAIAKHSLKQYGSPICIFSNAYPPSSAARKNILHGASLGSDFQKLLSSHKLSRSSVGRGKRVLVAADLEEGEVRAKNAKAGDCGEANVVISWTRPMIMDGAAFSAITTLFPCSSGYVDLAFVRVEDEWRFHSEAGDRAGMPGPPCSKNATVSLAGTPSSFIKMERIGQ